jgi:flagellar biosynthesis protein FliQ
MQQSISITNATKNTLLKGLMQAIAKFTIGLHHKPIIIKCSRAAVSQMHQKIHHLPITLKCTSIINAMYNTLLAALMQAIAKFTIGLHHKPIIIKCSRAAVSQMLQKIHHLPITLKCTSIINAMYNTLLAALMQAIAKFTTGLHHIGIQQQHKCSK